MRKVIRRTGNSPSSVSASISVCRKSVGYFRAHMHPCEMEKKKKKQTMHTKTYRERYEALKTKSKGAEYHLHQEQHVEGCFEQLSAALINLISFKYVCAKSFYGIMVFDKKIFFSNWSSK